MNKTQIEKNFLKLSSRVLIVLSYVLVPLGIFLGFYLNFMWFVSTISSFINHIKENPVDSAKIAYDIAAFFFRGFVFLLVMVATQIPSFLAWIAGIFVGKVLEDRIRSDR